jgi:tetratricopeptide (TPR) repeat protein
MPQPLRDIWQWILDQPDQVQAVLAVLTALGSVLIFVLVNVVYRGGKWLALRLRRKRLTGEASSIHVISDPQALMTSLYGVPRDNDPLADQNIPYQQRTPGRDLQGRLRKELHDHRCLLITGRTGLGKTREAAMLTSSLMNEGWRVVRVIPGWLEPLTALPAGLNSDRRRVLILLDDLNGLFRAGVAAPSPAKDDPGRLPSYRDRLSALLDSLDKMCGEGEVRVLATARDEPEEWVRLEYNPTDPLWRRFTRFTLPIPEDEAVEGLLEEATANAELPAERSDFSVIAAANDGTFANVVLNLRRAKERYRTDRSYKIARIGYTETLEGSWREVYERVVKVKPSVAHIYEAIALLRQMRRPLDRDHVTWVAAGIWGGNSLQRLARRHEVRRVLRYLTETTHILTVSESGRLILRDGQIEASGAKWESQLPSWDLFLLTLSGSSWVGEVHIWSLHNYVPELFDSTSNKGVAALKRVVARLLLSPSSTYRLLGDILGQEFGLWDQAEIAYRAAIRVFRSENWPFQRLSYNRVRLSALYERLGDVLTEQPGREAEAEAAYRDTIRLSPTYAGAYARLGILLARHPERVVEAQAAYHEALRLDPTLDYAHSGLGILLTKQPDQQTRAEAEFREMIRLDPTAPRPYYHLGNLLRKSGRLNEALTATLKSHDLQPGFHTLVGLAGIYQQMGDAANARHYATEARALADTGRAYGLACLEAITENEDAALAQLRRAKEMEWLDTVWAWGDPDFESLRDDPRFREIVGPPPA